MWQVGWDKETSEIVSVHGHKDGALQTDRRLVTLNQSGRDLSAQSFLEIHKKILDKKRQGYDWAISDKKRIPLQLALEYIPPAKEQESNVHPDTFPLGAQPKLDGIRGRAFLDDKGEVVIQSRKNLPFSWLAGPKSDVAILLSFLPSGTELDGELYSPGLTFQELTSAIRTVRTEPTNNKAIDYYIFDLIVGERTLEQRYTDLCVAYKSFGEHVAQEIAAGQRQRQYIQVVELTAVRSHLEIEALHSRYISDGFEGLMLRWFAGEHPSKTRRELSLYKGDRNANLLKYKLFVEEEGTIIDVVSGEGREEGLAIFVVRDARGKDFRCRPRGDFATRQTWFANPEMCIGKILTYVYFEFTDGGLPRFPAGKSFRDYEG